MGRVFPVTCLRYVDETLCAGRLPSPPLPFLRAG